MFDVEYERWLEEYNHLMCELRDAIQEHVHENELRLYVTNCLAHYDHVMNLKRLVDKTYIFHLVFGMRKTPTQRCFMWIVASDHLNSSSFSSVLALLSSFILCYGFLLHAHSPKFFHSLCWVSPLCSLARVLAFSLLVCPSCLLSRVLSKCGEGREEEGGEGDGVEGGEGDGDKGGQSESECEEVDMFGGDEAAPLQKIYVCATKLEIPELPIEFEVVQRWLMTTNSMTHRSFSSFIL
ncbi:hypothetical protein VNO77_34500 [Canavalia gladiata]|uniref:DOG1 domain-containing protein n=1 Tax=Canavalia gladiata TaxID=3824 RepID=A0AAN9Q1U8_CANGL